MKVMIELAVGAEVLQNNYHLEDLYQTTLEIYLPKPLTLYKSRSRFVQLIKRVKVPEVLCKVFPRIGRHLFFYLHKSTGKESQVDECMAIITFNGPTKEPLNAD